MKVASNDCFNSITHEILYGIDIKIDGKWCHAHENGNPLFFNTEEERDEKIKEIIEKGRIIK